MHAINTIFKLIKKPINEKSAGIVPPADFYRITLYPVFPTISFYNKEPNKSTKNSTCK